VRRRGAGGGSIGVPVVDTGHYARLRAALKRKGADLDPTPLTQKSDPQLWRAIPSKKLKDVSIGAAVSPIDAMMRWVDRHAWDEALRTGAEPVGDLVSTLRDLYAVTGDGFYLDMAASIEMEVIRHGRSRDIGAAALLWRRLLESDWGPLEPLKKHIFSYIDPKQIEASTYTAAVALTLGLPSSMIKDIVGTVFLQALPGRTVSFVEAMMGMGPKHAKQLVDLVGVSTIYESKHLQEAELADIERVSLRTTHPLSPVREGAQPVAQDRAYAEAAAKYAVALDRARDRMVLAARRAAEKAGIADKVTVAPVGPGLSSDDIIRLMTVGDDHGKWIPVGGEFEAALHREVQWRIFFSVSATARTCSRRRLRTSGV